MRNVGAAALAHVVARAARHEQRVRTGDEIRAAASSRSSRSTGRRSRAAGLASRRWMYFGQLPKLCSTVTKIPSASTRAMIPFGANSPPRDQIEPENPDPAALTETGARGIVEIRLRGDAKRRRVSASRRTLALPSERSPRPALSIDDADEQIAQMREELAVLLRHERPDT